MDIAQLLKDLHPPICALSYIVDEDNPVVCQMGFAILNNSIILHTSTWMYKWKHICDNQKVSLAIGLNHLSNYSQVFGNIFKLESTYSKFEEYESYYFQWHPDAIYYKKGQEGMFIVKPYAIRMATVIDRQTNFTLYEFQAQ